MTNDHRVNILKMQLIQAEAALRASERLKNAAEEAYGEVKDQLLRVVRTTLSTEWNDLLAEDPHAHKRSHEEIADWIIEKTRTRMNRLRWAADPKVAERMESVAKENKRLKAQLEEAKNALATLQAKYEDVIRQGQAKDAELARLREDVTSLREQATVLREARQRARPRPSGEIGDDSDSAEAPEWLSGWQDSDTYQMDREVLRVIGLRGLSLRSDVAKAVTSLDSSTSGTARRLFDRLGDLGVIEEERPRGEIGGGTPYLLRLTERGKEAFQLLFDDEPVESEYDRLMARHKSPEHVLLNMKARDVLLEAGADSVDMYPRPVTLPDGGRLDVDLVAVFDGEPLYIEAERSRSKKVREAKWTNLASIAGNLYVVVPNKKVKSAVISEITKWAYDDRDRAAGVVLHVCCLSTDGELWEYRRVVAGKG